MRMAFVAALGLLAIVPGLARAAGATVKAGDVKQGLFATCFADAKTGWMVGELGRIFRTTDGGLTWERQDAGTKRPFFTVTCVDPKTVWIAGKEGSVYGTDRRRCHLGRRHHRLDPPPLQPPLSHRHARPRRRRLRHHAAHRGRREDVADAAHRRTSSSFPTARSTPASTPAT